MKTRKARQVKKANGAAPCDVIASMRVKAKLSQGELARALGVGQSVLSKFEKGRTKVPLTALLAIADACGFQIQAVSAAGQRIAVKPGTAYERVGVRAAQRTKATKATAVQRDNENKQVKTM